MMLKPVQEQEITNQILIVRFFTVEVKLVDLTFKFTYLSIILLLLVVSCRIR